uniref:FCP1 homology domain-containing protein n=1 Tax=viral metagenome TaxID=1070528 RepID=A0A6C0EK39_9ZZZZ
MSNKPRILLDLDQTIISAEPSEEYDFKKNKAKSKKFAHHDMDGYYIVFERPNLQKFLDFLFQNYLVSIWTAASKDYALFIIDKVVLAGKKDRKIDYIFFSYHCDISKDKKKGSKDLSMLWDIYKIDGYSKDNTVILDDYDEVHKTQPCNCIVAMPFEFTKEGSENDDFLNGLIPQLTQLGEKVGKGDKIASTVKSINKK